MPVKRHHHFIPDADHPAPGSPRRRGVTARPFTPLAAARAS
jgi:hypothetical protein